MKLGFVNEVVLKQGHIQFFTHCVTVAAQQKRSCNRESGLCRVGNIYFAELEIFIIQTFIKEACSSLPCTLKVSL